ncbi:hypothetical protein T11_8761 [Trichinella zimbabwensis]|uniref:Uncharacterized protein n=1 Tax=Trichinella zimbabwensis TaxID=268475 RepID=A0A0V1I196_9BILA|nr:hypothetical protein T11_8761 [Trichinella zimbabwensis]
MNGEGKNADVKLEKQMCAEVNGKPYCAFNSMNVNEDLVRKKQIASKYPFNSYHVEIVEQQQQQQLYSKNKLPPLPPPPPPPTRQARVYCISVWRRGFSSPRDVVIISVAGMIRVHKHSVIVFNTEKGKFFDSNF